MLAEEPKKIMLCIFKAFKIALGNLRNKQSIAEIVLLMIIILTALYVGFYDPENLTHPLHGDLLLSGNAIYNIHNNIPFEVNGHLQWIDERVHYFYTAPLYFFYSSLFWDNYKDYVANFIPSTILSVVFTYLVVYLFTRRYFGNKVALLGLFLMSLTTQWYNYIVRSLYGSWAALPGICVIIFWLYIKFNETNKMKFMLFAGIVAGMGFYFVPWPLLVIVIPALFLVLFIIPSEISKKRRFSGYLCCILVIISIIFLKEILFIKTGLRYNGDPSGIEAFYKIFFQGAYIGRGEDQLIFTHNLIPYLFSRLSIFGALLFSDFSLNGYQLVSPIVLITAIPGLVLMLNHRQYVYRFLAACFLVIFAIVIVFINDSAPRYFLPVFPIVFISSAIFIDRAYIFIKTYPFTEKIGTLLKNCSTVKETKYEKRRHPDKINSFFCIAFICVVSIGVLGNIYGTHIYMEKTLPTYSQFEYNCYNSIEWPFQELKAYLKEKQTVYDLIVIPNSFTTQMITYFRLHPGFVHLEGESYGKNVITHSNFRNKVDIINKDANNSKILIIANNYNELLNDQICPGPGARGSDRIPFDKNALTMEEVEKLVPTAKFVKFVGSKNYPTLLALYETDPFDNSSNINIINTSSVASIK